MIFSIFSEQMLETIKHDAIIHVGGAGGHSQIPSMAMWYRAGGIANIDIMFSPGLGLFDGKPCLERVPGMGGYTMAYHNVKPEDLVIVCNYYGMNAATIDMALAAKNKAVSYGKRAGGCNWNATVKLNNALLGLFTTMGTKL
jgi:uncharacterized phosphosugar-binding protein